ncbi:DUF1932 domain-containing protein [Glycomyces sp. NPDC047369]
MNAPLRIAVLGLGEAGSAVASGLAAAGADVRGHDPAAPVPPGVTARSGEADAVRDADLVISLTTAEHAEAAMRAALPELRPGALWADANTAAPSQKAALARLVPGGFTDVALMAPVPGLGLRTPMLASGPGAERFRRHLEPLGARIDTVPGPPGAANSRKLLRSVVYKGIAAAIVEGLQGAQAAGLEDWYRDHIAAELASFDTRTFERMVAGTFRHAARRADEMDAAARQLRDLGLDPRIAPAARDALEALARRRA